MAQKYISEIRKGDKRIILIKGEAIPYSLARIPPKNDIRANLAKGGKGKAQKLTAGDKKIVKGVKEFLIKNQLNFVGLDVIGNYLTEINITSPTGIVEIEEQTNFKAATYIINALNSLLIFLLIGFLFGCSDNKIYQEKDFIFGTLIDIKIYGESKMNAEKVSSEIFSEFHRLHKLLHPWEKSLITDINNAISEKKSIAINNDEVISILTDAQHLEAQTQTLFNPSIGKLIKLWGFHSNDHNQEVIPNQDTIKKLVSSNPSMKSIEIEKKILKSNNQDVQIDLVEKVKVMH